MSFQLQEWERGMSSMPSGSGWLAGLPSPSRGVPALLGTSLPQPLPKVHVVIFDRGAEAVSLWGGLEGQSPWAPGAPSAAAGSAGLWGPAPLWGSAPPAIPCPCQPSGDSSCSR